MMKATSDDTAYVLKHFATLQIVVRIIITTAEFYMSMSHYTHILFYIQFA